VTTVGLNPRSMCACGLIYAMCVIVRREAKLRRASSAMRRKIQYSLYCVDSSKWSSITRRASIALSRGVKCRRPPVDNRFSRLSKTAASDRRHASAPNITPGRLARVSAKRPISIEEAANRGIQLERGRSTEGGIRACEQKLTVASRRSRKWKRASWAAPSSRRSGGCAPSTAAASCSARRGVRI